MRRLVVVGCGGLARETIEVVRAVNSQSPQWDVVGLVDDNPQFHGRTVAQLPVLGGTDELAAFPEAAVVLCVGGPRSPHSRATLAGRLGLTDERYATLIHPSAAIATSCRVGAGSIVLAGVVATADVSVGRHVVLMPAVVLTHDDVLADCVTVAAGVRVSGGVDVGASAYLGAGSVVRENVRIGAGATLGAASLALSDVPAGETWVGTPARYLRSS